MSWRPACSSELRRLIARNPKLVLGELTTQLVEDGFANDTAAQVSTELPLDEDRFLNFTARTVFGVNPDELGSPLTAATNSLVLFAVGALIPLAPWFFTSGAAAVGTSVVLTAACQPVHRRARQQVERQLDVRRRARQLAIVALASAITYGIGALFGTAIA